MDFSIVVPTWNRPQLVDALLESLYEERKNYALGETDVLIVDSSKGEEQAATMASCAKSGAPHIDGDDLV